MTEELNFKAICDLAVSVCDISKNDLFSKSRKRPIQIVRAIISYIAIKEEDMSRNIIANVLDRDRASTYHYEKKHKQDYLTSRIYRNTFNKIYKAYKDIDGAKEIFIDKDYMKSFLLKNGVKEKLNSDLLLEIKSGEVKCCVKTSYFDFSTQVENINLALKNYHYTIKIK
tara:strand:- start:8342 stop:8851 length:510 start_codon:yes stop_codon:yes gene_type:complete